MKIPTKKKKYAVYPGMITSRHDGDWHFISAQQLMRLYGVDPAECVIKDMRRPEHIGINTTGMVRLYPRNDGNYEISGST